MCLRVLCAFFLLSVTLGSCSKNSSSNATDNVQRPQLSTLENFLRTQQSFIIINSDNASDVLQASPEMQNVASDKSLEQRLSVTNSTGMDIIVNSLDIDPIWDYLLLTPLNADGTESRPIILTGKLKEPLNIRFLGYTQANLNFSAKTEESHQGFSISYAPHGEIPLPGIQPPDITIPFDQLQTSSKLLVVPHQKQTQATWNKIKELLAISTNYYMNSSKFSLEQAKPQNVTLTRVANCFDSWPDSENCVEVEFAITLYNDTRKTSSADAFLEDRTPREPAGLTGDQLDAMWVQFGKSLFERDSISEYELPDTRSRILMWVGIALGTCVILFLIFVAVFRSPRFRDRWVEDDTVAIKSKDGNSGRSSEDITMYPSPDQDVPDMFPGGNHLGAAINGQLPSTEFGLDVGCVRANNFDTINEANTEDEKPSTRM